MSSANRRVKNLVAFGTVREVNNNTYWRSILLLTQVESQNSENMTKFRIRRRVGPRFYFFDSSNFGGIEKIGDEVTFWWSILPPSFYHY